MFRTMGMYLRTIGLRGLLYAIKAKVTNATVNFKMQRHDCRHPFRLRIPSSDVLTYKQVFINQEYDFVAEVQPKVIVDAGANIGLTSIYFANRYPGAKIFAIEPEQSNFQVLKDNVAAYSAITPIQAALWNHNEEINVVDPGLGKWGFMTGAIGGTEILPGDICHTVKAITIDRLMEDYGLTKIDILKVDIEGAEKEVFGDASSWIEGVDSIIIELHERLRAGCNRSFYCGTNGFDREWSRGESIFLTRDTCLTRRTIH